MHTWRAGDDGHVKNKKQAVKIQALLLCLVAKLCSTLWDSMDFSPPGSSAMGFSALAWVAIPFLRGSSWLRDWTCVSYTGRQILYTEPPGKPQYRHTSFYCALLYCALQFCVFKQIVAILCQTSLLVSFFYQHLLTSGLWSNSLNISNFYIIIIFVMDLWSLIFGVTILLVLGYHKLYPHKTANLIDKCCVCLTAPLTSHSPNSLPLFRLPYSLRHNNTEIRPINNPRMACKCSMKGRIAHLSL